MPTTRIKLKTLNEINRRQRDPSDIYSGVSSDEGIGDHDEKPWKRVYYEVTRKGTHLYEPVKSVPSVLIILFIGMFMLLGYLTQLIEDDMPEVVKESDIAENATNKFSEEKAWEYLLQIVGDQPRVAGTLYHYQKTKDLKDILDSIATEATLPVRTDLQLVTGDYRLNFASPFVNYYQNVTNLVAVLEGESGFHGNGSIGTSLLVNCHYDSVPFALGASDNALFCAVMVETLSKLSKRQHKFKHNIVFLFNGAEETPLQGSHAFLQHPWSKGVTNVINLDSAGINGKAHVFQVSDVRILDAYRRTVKTPSAQAFGEFLFTSGVIPSDTDFRVFRDFGHIHGVDIAFTKGGHVYHTRNDRPDLLKPGVMQWAGNMLLPFVSEVADTAELETQIAPAPAVYYDYLYLFVVTYSLSGAAFVDVMVVLLTGSSIAYYIWLVGMRKSTVVELLYSMLGRFLSMMAGILLVAVSTPIVVTFTAQLRYLSQAWILVPIVWLPYCIGAVAMAHFYDDWRTKKNGQNRSIRTAQAMAATRCIMGLVLLPLIMVPSFATFRYVVAAPLFIMSAVSFLSLTIIRYFNLKGWQHLLLELVLSLPSVMFALSVALRVDALLLPIMGRTPSDCPDYVVAISNVALAILVSTTVSGVELLFSRHRLWAILSGLLAVCILVMFLPFSPYNDDGPSTQRHYWFNTEITTYDANYVPVSRTSGVLVTKYDANTIPYTLKALKEKNYNFNMKTNFESDCDMFVHCNLPLFRSTYGKYLPDALFLYTAPPAPFNPPPSMRLIKRTCASDKCTVQFAVVGSANNLLTLWPRGNVTIDSWSWASPVNASFVQNGRPVYTVTHVRATYSENPVYFEYTLILNVPVSVQSAPLLDISHHAHKVYHPDDYTPEYRKLIEDMPKYFNIANFLSFRSNYVF